MAGRFSRCPAQTETHSCDLDVRHAGNHHCPTCRQTWTPPTDPGHWRDRAACRGTGRAMWITGDINVPRQRARIERALTVCRTCPVLDDCRRWVDQLAERMVGVVVAGRTHPLPTTGGAERRRRKEAS